jgi:Calcineurin-like phosphoesterase
MVKRSTGRRRSSAEPLRYAPPFFSTTPPEQRAVAPAAGTRRMRDFATEHLGPIPPPRGSTIVDLTDIIGKAGVDSIEASGSIHFHTVGDTGRASGDSTDQDDVAEAMTSDYRAGHDGTNPAFFLHLGDVIYGHRKTTLYRDEFYRPYMKYPGKILAIPGNHDGETFKETDPKPLQAFFDNFCAPKAAVPKVASDVGIFRETMTQPGVYWLLKAPFLNLIGLYSNIAEGPGDLRGANADNKQIKWLQATLANLKKAKDAGDNRALVIATHHPVFSEGGHSSSDIMRSQIDQVCTTAGIVPHALLAGHTHTYQRYTRTIRRPMPAQMICIDVGCGGHAAPSVKDATGQTVDDAIFVKSRRGYGYVLATANNDQLVLEMFRTDGGRKSSFDKATIGLASRSVT